jgi:hypothetical protein
MLVLVASLSFEELFWSALPGYQALSLFSQASFSPNQ